MELRGVPSVAVCTDRFVNLGEVERRTLGMPDLSMATAMHPIGGLRVDAVQAKAETLLEQVVRGLTGQ